MIVTKNVTMNGMELKETYSDAGVKIACGLEVYDVAYDAPDSMREYEETSMKISNFEIAADVALAEIAEVIGV